MYITLSYKPNSPTNWGSILQHVWRFKQQKMGTWAAMRQWDSSSNQWLVGRWAIPLKNMSSWVGMMTFPIYGKINLNVPNHQPDENFTSIFSVLFLFAVRRCGRDTIGDERSWETDNMLAAAQTRCEHTCTDTTWQSWKLYSQCGTPSYHCVDNPHEYYS